MKRGFYTIMAAQFFSSLADNALLVAAIALLIQVHAPAWMTPLLKFYFVVSYVALAAFVGAFADSMPKGRVMFITNTIKIVGCAVMFFYESLTPSAVHPYVAIMVAYGIVGLGAAAYSPAKYGILTELLPAEKLVVANGWIEGLTVSSIILGTLVGGILISPSIAARFLAWDFPMIDTSIDSAPEAAIAIIAIFYAIAAAFNLYIPDTGVDHRAIKKNPFHLFHEFWHCNRLLWKDKLGQVSLATTTLFWGAGATLQFIVLDWARVAFGLPLNQATMLQGVVAVGIAIGAVFAARTVPLRRSPHVLPVGIAMGFIVLILAFYDKGVGPSAELPIGPWALPAYLLVAGALLVVVGGLAGFFVVPMNALLQHRGHILMGAGHSIAVQNFNENLSILIMLGCYTAMVKAEFSITVAIVMFGLFVSANMLLVYIRFRHNQRREDALHLIGAERSDGPH